MVKAKKNSFFKQLLVKKWLLLSLLAVLIATGVWAFMRPDQNKSTQTPQATNLDTTKSGASVNLSPPTNQEKQEADARKSEISSQPSTATSSSGKKQVTPVITYADKNGANAYVPGVFEEGGTCTATFTKDANNIVATSTGFQNSNYTSCAPMKLPGPLNISGIWSVVVSYSSSTSQGKSSAYTVQVP